MWQSNCEKRRIGVVGPMTELKLSLLVLCLCLTAAAQSTNLSGYVHDQNGAAVAGATVWLKVPGSPEIKGATNADGYFHSNICR